MAEKIADVIEDLEKLKEYEGPAFKGFREAGLSREAEFVLDKLKTTHPSDGLHRVYRMTKRGPEIADALTDHEIKVRNYKPTEADPITIDGSSPAKRDVLREHTSEEVPDDRTLWIGERLE